MTLINIIILAIIQGLAELLPVSSSAHVIIAAKILKMPPASTPEMTLLIIMLHTGTMFAVIVYFWKTWKRTYFSSARAFGKILPHLVLATALTGVVGLGLKAGIEKYFLAGTPKAEIEMLFDNLPLIAAGLAAAGILIIAAGLRPAVPESPELVDLVEHKRHLAADILLTTADDKKTAGAARGRLQLSDSAVIGMVQGLCLPFRGFSRSGSTISTGMLLGVGKARVEAFSFALAVILTPPLIARELLRVLKENKEAVNGGGQSIFHLLQPDLVGLIFSFLAGMLALVWLSRWLERGRWYLFGIYCLLASAGVLALHFHLKAGI